MKRWDGFSVGFMFDDRVADSSSGFTVVNLCKSFLMSHVMSALDRKAPGFDCEWRVVVNDGVAPTVATSEPYVPVSWHTAPQSFSFCHKYHSFGELVLTSDEHLRNLLVFGRDNADEEYSCYRGCSFPLNREGCDGRPPRYLHP